MPWSRRRPGNGRLGPAGSRRGAAQEWAVTVSCPAGSGRRWRAGDRPETDEGLASSSSAKRATTCRRGRPWGPIAARASRGHRKAHFEPGHCHIKCMVWPSPVLASDLVATDRHDLASETPFGYGIATPPERMPERYRDQTRRHPCQRAPRALDPSKRAGQIAMVRDSGASLASHSRPARD